jgi:hypothetical protein
MGLTESDATLPEYMIFANPDDNLLHDAYFKVSIAT